MDRFSFRAAVHIAQAEFRQWLRSSRIIILFVMLVFVNVQVIGPLRQCKMLMGEMLSIPEAFVALGNSGVILLIIPILFLVLMADFPQRTGIDRFYQMRCTKRTWIFGQAVFAAAASCFVLLFLLVSSCVLMIGTGRWSLSFSDAVTHFTSVYPDRTGDYVVQLLPGNLYQQMTLEQALIHTFLSAAFIFYAHIICAAFFGCQQSQICGDTRKWFCNHTRSSHLRGQNEADVDTSDGAYDTVAAL